MALLNRNLKWKDADEIPLMDKNENKILADDEITFNTGHDDSDDEETQTKPFKQQDITLWLSDAVVLIIEHLQYYAVLLALSEHWGWPMDWIKASSFAFLFNIDIWEFRKVETGAFDHSRTSFITSSTMGFNYISYLGAWVVILCIIGGIFSIIYLRWLKRRPLYLLLYIARWKRVMFLVLQFLCVPFGVAAARVFHCREDLTMGKDVMDVQNEFECLAGPHIVFMVLVVIIYIFLFAVYPFILSRWIRDQVFSTDPMRHEGYLQLKEAEYEQGLDILWDIGQYHLFSSYRRFWIFYNPLKFIFKLLIVVGFALSIRSTFYSSAALTALFVVATFTLIFKRPYRVRCFNGMIICSHLLMSANILIGNFMVRPPWEDPEQFQIVSFLQYPNILHILVALNAAWLIILLLWIIYLVLLNNGVLGKERVWPRLSYESSNAIGEDTKKYLKAALKARHTLEHALSAIPLFAPIHELSHQIKVINAYCREAEFIGDPTHDTLWDLLDELIEAHNMLVPVSVFGMSGKNSIRETSEEFIKLMPCFKKRLKQREYDYILVPPVKRRLLLKMYVLSIFVSNKRKQISPEEEVARKLQEALTMFEGRSLDDYESGFDSLSNSVSTASRPLSSRPISEGQSRGDTSMSHFGADTSMSGFINDLDTFTSSHPRQSISSKKLSMQSQHSKSSPSRRKKSSITGQRSSKVSIDSKQSSLPSSPLARHSEPAEKISIHTPSSSPDSKSAEKVSIHSPPLSKQSKNRVLPLPFGSSESVKSDHSRPSTAPLSPQPGLSSPSTSSRPGTAPIEAIHKTSTFSSSSKQDITLPSQSNQGSTSSLSSGRLGAAPIIATPQRSASPASLSRPGTAPLSPRHSPSPLVSLSRPGTAPTGSRNNSPLLPEMSSTLSLPGQIEDEEEYKTKHSSTVLE